MKFHNLKIAIIDDHRIYLDSLKDYLEKFDSIKLVDIFTNIKDYIKFGKRYDAVLLDLDLNGSSGLEFFDKRFSDNVLMLTSHKEISNIKLAYKLGAKGYILKSAETEEMIDAIKVVANGDNYYSKDLIVENKMSDELTLDTLTKKQIAILRMLTEGKSYQEISEKLFISESTVKVHKYNIIKKLNLETDSDLAKLFSVYFKSNTII